MRPHLLQPAPRATGEWGARARQHRLRSVEHDRQVVLRFRVAGSDFALRFTTRSSSLPRARGASAAQVGDAKGIRKKITEINIPRIRCSLLRTRLRYGLIRRPGRASGQRAAAAKKGPIGKRPGPAAETRDIRVPVHHIWVMAEGRFISFVSFRRQVGSPGFPKTYGRGPSDEHFMIRSRNITN